MRFEKFSRQQGFTLIEILVALSLITLLAVAITLSYDGARSKAQTMVSTMTELGSANKRLKNDTGCYVNRPSALVDPTIGRAAASNFCTRSLANTWNGPYVGKFAYDATSGAALLDRISSGLSITFTRTAGGLGQRYTVNAANVPSDIVTQALIECNGDDDAGDFAMNTCVGNVAAGTFSVLFDETR